MRLLDRACDRVAAELVAERRGDLRGELISSRDAKRAKSDAAITGAGTFSLIASLIVQRPSPESSTYGAMSSSFEPCCSKAACSSSSSQRANDRAVAPDAGDLVQVEVVLGVLHDLEALGVRLHQAVLDPVVDHLHEVARAGRADVRVAVLGRERLEDRLEPLRPARRRRRPSGRSRPRGPRSRRRRRRRRSGCPSCCAFDVAALRVVEVRVAAVDDRVALVGDPKQLLEGVLGDLPGRDHHPERARRAQLLASAPRATSARALLDLAGRTSARRGPCSRRRSVIPAPMRPRPIIPSCISDVLQSDAHDRAGRAPSATAKSPAACARISRAEAEGLARDRQLLARCRRRPARRGPSVGPPLCSWPVECR